MQQIKILITSVAVFLSCTIFAQETPPLVGGPASLPPAYLGVKKFKQCLSTKSMGTWESWCIPEKKPKKCPSNSWRILQKQSIPNCKNKKNQLKVINGGGL